MLKSREKAFFLGHSRVFLHFPVHGQILYSVSLQLFSNCFVDVALARARAQGITKKQKWSLNLDHEKAAKSKSRSFSGCCYFFKWNLIDNFLTMVSTAISWCCCFSSFFIKLSPRCSCKMFICSHLELMHKIMIIMMGMKKMVDFWEMSHVVTLPLNLTSVFTL